MKTKILFIADGRSPITLGWLSHFVEDTYDVHLISSFPCEQPEGTSSLHFVPVAFSGAAVPSGERLKPAPGGARGIRARSLIRHWLGPLTVRRAAKAVNTIADQLKPDLIHALRIPYEGMMAADVIGNTPIVTSVWGNDFTLHAVASPGMRRLTHKAMARSDAVHTDCDRDVRLAKDWGFTGRHSIVLPGGGGIRQEIFHPSLITSVPTSEDTLEFLKGIMPDTPVIINPRGFRAYVRNDTFFQSIPIILEEYPNSVFLCIGMRDEREAEIWVERLELGQNVRLLPKLGHQEMAAAFQRSWISVSPSEHDGTPNTFLESIACGCFPVAGDIESLREWIDHGRTGLLADPGDTDAWARAVVRAIRDKALRISAAEVNQQIISERAEYRRTGEQARAFYTQVLS